MSIVHHHLIYQAKVSREDLGEDSESELRRFLYSLLSEIDMQELIPAQIKLSYQKAWTGIMGIITSHISFHYWIIEKYVQVDVYSCKSFDKQRAVLFLNDFWKAENVRTLFIDRKVGEDFKIS
jgi:S-adenosylmethionine/arginine decarboxylase-like enzyme